MGYSTEFDGQINITPKPKAKLASFVNMMNSSRRMNREDSDIYGPGSHLYVHGGFTPKILDNNNPPPLQPGLWMQWEIVDGKLQWDKGEKFYNYVEWLIYLINNIFAPLGHRLNGVIIWEGDYREDIGTISVKNNVIEVLTGYSLTVEELDNHKVIGDVFTNDPDDDYAISYTMFQPKVGPKIDIDALMEEPKR